MGELIDGVQIRMINDIEKFTKLFVEDSLGVYFDDEEEGSELQDPNQIPDGSEDRGSTQVHAYKIGNNFKLYTNNYLREYVLKWRNYIWKL